MARTLRYVAAALAMGAVALCVGCMLWLDWRTTYYVQVYKPKQTIEAGDEKALKSRLEPFRFEECTVYLEWFTYDNEDPYAGPYKLFVVIEPHSRSLASVEIVSVTLRSSKGLAYEFGPEVQFPAVIPISGSERASSLFEPAFPFDFDGGEVVQSEMVIRILDGERSREEKIDVEWHPIVVRQWASIV